MGKNEYWGLEVGERLVWRLR